MSTPADPTNNDNPTAADIARADAVLRAAPNPFTGSDMRSAHQEPVAHVEHVHRDVYARLVGIIDDARRSPRGVLQPILGDPGDGKTHLLARLRRLAEISFFTKEPFALAIIMPLRDRERPYQHMLREAGDSLHRRLPYFSSLSTRPDNSNNNNTTNNNANNSLNLSPQPRSQLERLAWLGIARAVRHLAERDPSLADLAADAALIPRYLGTFIDEFRAEVAQRGPAFLAQSLEFADGERIDAEVWRVVWQLASPSADTVAAAVRWLRGGHLTEEELEQHHLPPPVDDEDSAYRVLRSLVQLGGVPLVFGFDQLEGVDFRGEETLKRLFAAMAELYNDTDLIQFLFCQTGIWAGAMTRIEQQIRDRLSGALSLDTLSLDDARALIVGRLAPVYRGASLAPPRPGYPLDLADIEDAYKRNLLPNPRRVLRYCAERFDAWRTQSTAAPRSKQVPPPKQPKLTDEERGRRKFEELLARELAGDARRTAEDRAMLAKSAIERALIASIKTGTPIGDATVEEVKPPPRGEHGMHLRLARRGRRQRVYLEVSNSPNGKAMANVASRLTGAVDNQKVDRAVLVRQSDQMLPPKAQEMITQSKGTAILWLGKEAFPPLAALDALLDAARELEIPDATSMKMCADIGAGLAATQKLVDVIFAAGDVAPRPAQDQINRALATIEACLRETSVWSVGDLTAKVGEPAATAAAIEQLVARHAVSVHTDRDDVRTIVRSSVRVPSGRP